MTTTFGRMKIDSGRKWKPLLMLRLIFVLHIPLLNSIIIINGRLFRLFLEIFIAKPKKYLFSLRKRRLLLTKIKIFVYLF